MAEDEAKTFTPRPSHLFPVVLSLALTGLLALPLIMDHIEVPSVTPFEGTTYPEASLNALFFVVALAASATMMFLLVKRGKMNFLRNMIKVAVVVVCITVVYWYATVLFIFAGRPLQGPAGMILVLATSLATGSGLSLLIFSKRKSLPVAGAVLVSGFTGLFLGASISLLTALVLAAALVVYDILAVFRGPVGALAKSLELGDLRGAVFNYRELTIGMGDMVFYSLLATTALLNFGVLPFLLAGIGILGGTFLGFKALQKFEMFPGLPFSLVLGVAGMLIAGLL